MTCIRSAAASIFLLCLLAQAPAIAEVRLEGYFIARSACPAFQSIRRQTNPGNIRLEVDRAYRLFSKNKEAATHYLIENRDAEPPRRWVEVGCGEHVVPVDLIARPPDDPTDEPGPQGGRSNYVLAVSWQPGFCETRPGKPECESQTEGRFDADHFTLHGLWPQPRNNIYCNVDPQQVRLDKDRDWLQLATLVLDQATRDELNVVMPGTQSGLHRHEWTKHGTCYNGESAERFYTDSLRLMSQLNNSDVRTLFADNIGQEISREDIGEAFEVAFGAGVSDRVSVSCKQDGSRRLVTELLISLKGEIGPEGDIGAFMRDAPVRSPGCANGIVDPVGLQ